MSYLSRSEFLDLGFDEVSDFDKLERLASYAVDLFTGNFYQFNDIEKDFHLRKRLVKRAMAFQISYLEQSGVLSAEDKQAISNMTIGRTRVDYQNSPNSAIYGKQYNLSLDAIHWLEQAGFGSARVSYDR